MNKYKRLIILFFFIACISLNLKSVYASSNINRIYGKDRYSTSISVSSKKFSQADNVVIASGEVFADSLCASPLAKKLNAPIILVQKKLTSEAKNEILRLKAKNAYIIGGSGVISNSVESELNAKGIKAERIAGTDRYSTSIEVAKKFNSANKAFVVLGTNFPDAISVAPVAGRDEVPIILTQENSVPKVVNDYLKNKVISKSYVIGGPKLISDLGIAGIPNIERIYGNDRYETNYKVIQKFMNDEIKSLYVASGKDFPDALVGSAISAKEGLPIALVGDKVNKNLSDFLKSKLSSSATINILGGEKVVATSIANSIASINNTTNNTTTNTETSTNKKLKICIDPGHGGDDPTAGVGPNGTKEGEVNLNLALKVGRILSEKGMEVVYTRTEDKYLSDSERVNIAKSNSSDLFISIRCNSYSDYNANGIETYYLSDNPNSQSLAKSIQEKIGFSIDLKDRGYKPDSNHNILKDVNCTSAMIFFGFITNEQDESKISSSYFQETTAHAIAVGILNYVNTRDQNNNSEGASNQGETNVSTTGNIVCIDAGHGGYDSGAVGPTRIKEKDVTLKVSLKVGQKLTQKGIKVVYTRTSDKVSWPSNVSQDLAKRVEIAKNAGANYFICIHCNSATPAAYGIETYYCTSNNANGKSALLAKNIQDELKKIANYNRGVKTANWYVNRNANCPSILTEIGFISNAKEEKFLASADGQEQIAQLITNGILKTMGK